MKVVKLENELFERKVRGKLPWLALGKEDALGLEVGHLVAVEEAATGRVLLERVRDIINSYELPGLLTSGAVIATTKSVDVVVDTQMFGVYDWRETL